MDSFKQYLYPTEDEKMVLVSNVGRLLEDLLSEGQSHETDNEVRNMYKLLDIEQKGCITENDIEDFIRQL
jgi:Ca2+-binding EF-hand superfamily protein